MAIITATHDAQWLRGALPLCVLSLLADGESYGYELSRRLASAGIGDIKGGTLYPVLARLEHDGHVAVRWETTGSGPARKYYQLTEDGQRRLREHGAAWTAFTQRVTSLLSAGMRRVA